MFPAPLQWCFYISQLIRFARVSCHPTDFSAYNKSLTTKLLQQGYRYYKLWKAFSKYCRRHFELVSKYKTGLRSLLQQVLSETEFYDDIVYKFRKIVGRGELSDQFKNIMRYIHISYNVDAMQQSASLVVKPVTVYNFAVPLIACRWVGVQTL